MFVLGLTATAAVQAAHTSARLALPVETARPGETVLAGVVLEMEPGWHTYWRNPGESGIATEIQWKLPEGVTAGEIQWPVPEVYEADGLVTYVHHDTAVLLVPLKLSDALPRGPLSIQAEVSWLECKVQCIPGRAVVNASLRVAEATTPSPSAPVIAQAESRLPRKSTDLGAKAAWEAPPENDERALIVEWPATQELRHARFFPYADEDHEIRPQMEPLPVDQSRVARRATVKSFKNTWPTELSGVIAFQQGSLARGYEIRVPIAEAEALPGRADAATPPSSGAGRGLWFFLLLGLGGGLILNLMPCVLPILSLKVLSMVRLGGSSTAARRQHGLVYTLGVLVSFWAIAGLVTAGSLASWGAQFQDPRFVVAVTVLMTLVALNLFGVFEVILPGSTVTRATEWSSREGAGGAFFNGVLAVILGASCVAPLLATAIGWAISQSPRVIFLVFTMIGLGLALPFLLLSFFPSLQHLLPKPGPWMEKFKVAMGFPMLATAAWLLSQTADHFGPAGPLWLGVFLVALALAAWIYGEFIQRGRRRKGVAALFALLFAAGGYVYALERELDWRHPPATPDGVHTSPARSGVNGIPWQPWSTAAVEQARQQGRPVLVDFTANWCLTCKLNKKTSLEIPAVKQKLADVNAVALLGDYTRKNPEITAELQRFERAGVPLVLVYPRDASKPPVVLPTLLTPEIVLDALDAAAR
jgi:thiol:disulfide interchange protein DsbD